MHPLGVPTLLVAGAQDGFTPTGVLQPLAESLKAEFAEFDVAHAFNEEPTYTLVTDAVIDFLDRATGENPTAARAISSRPTSRG